MLIYSYLTIILRLFNESMLIYSYLTIILRVFLNSPRENGQLGNSKILKDRHVPLYRIIVYLLFYTIQVFYLLWCTLYIESTFIMRLSNNLRHISCFVM